MRDQPIIYWPGVAAMLSGLLWLGLGFDHGLWLMLALVPGCLHLSTGMAMWLWPGDRRVQQFMALSAIAAVPFALLAAFGFGLLWSLLLILAAIAVYMVAGIGALRFDRPGPGVPSRSAHWRLAGKVALDEAIVAWFILMARIPDSDRSERMRSHGETLVAWHKDNEVSSLTDYHQPPKLPETVNQTACKASGQDYMHLTMPSTYRPLEGSPGAEQWHGLAPVRTAHAWMFRHDDQPRPWLVCIHGYCMGTPLLDFSLFRPSWTHQKMGMNLLMPILPLHGPRRIRRNSGAGFIDGEVSDTFHAISQGIHDIRCWMRWIRETQALPDGAQQPGVLGYSLGGYHAALLACLEPELACVIAGIPLTDLPGALWRHMPTQQRRFLKALGLKRPVLTQALAPVSPLAMSPVVDADRLTIFAASADRIVPPEQAARLANYWGIEPVWYEGAHLSVSREPVVAQALKQAWANAGLIRLNQA